MPLSCFKAYDIRGRVPQELNDQIVDRIGRAMGAFCKARKVVVGHDVRETSVQFHHTLVSALLESGVDVFDVGLCATEETYFACMSNSDYDYGLMITASHNPIEFNGLKIVKRGAAPMTEVDLSRLGNWVESQLEQMPYMAQRQGNLQALAGNRQAYVRHLMQYVNLDALAKRKLRILTNAGNGPAGLVLDMLEPLLPNVEVVKLNNQPDPSFPNGIPNPVLVEQRTFTAEQVRAHKADLGIAWDGDADRCCLFDAEGNYINPYYIIGLFAEKFLKQSQGATIVAEPRLNWATYDVAARLGGQVVRAKVGHGFIKQTMREADAVFGGEASGHFFFKNFGFCDSGMIPWLMFLSIMAESGQTAAQLVADRQTAFPCSDEMNLNLGEAATLLLKKLEEGYATEALETDHLDGLSMSFAEWRFNVRRSNNEPWLVRLNVEANTNPQLLQQKCDEVLNMLQDGQHA